MDLRLKGDFEKALMKYVEEGDKGPNALRQARLVQEAVLKFDDFCRNGGFDASVGLTSGFRSRLTTELKEIGVVVGRKYDELQAERAARVEREKERMSKTVGGDFRAGSKSSSVGSGGRGRSASLSCIG